MDVESEKEEGGEKERGGEKGNRNVVKGKIRPYVAAPMTKHERDYQKMRRQTNPTYFYTRAPGQLPVTHGLFEETTTTSTIIFNKDLDNLLEDDLDGYTIPDPYFYCFGNKCTKKYLHKSTLNGHLRLTHSDIYNDTVDLSKITINNLHKQYMNNYFKIIKNFISQNIEFQEGGDEPPSFPSPFPFGSNNENEKEIDLTIGDDPEHIKKDELFYDYFQKDVVAAGGWQGFWENNFFCVTETELETRYGTEEEIIQMYALSDDNYTPEELEELGDNYSLEDVEEVELEEDPPKRIRFAVERGKILKILLDREGNEFVLPGSLTKPGDFSGMTQQEFADISAHLQADYDNIQRAKQTSLARRKGQKRLGPPPANTDVVDLVSDKEEIPPPERKKRRIAPIHTPFADSPVQQPANIPPPSPPQHPADALPLPPQQLAQNPPLPEEPAHNPPPPQQLARNPSPPREIGRWRNGRYHTPTPPSDYDSSLEPVTPIPRPLPPPIVGPGEPTSAMELADYAEFDVKTPTTDDDVLDGGYETW